MRIDVGVWSKKKLVLEKLGQPQNVIENEYESHWLRFERKMGEGGFLSGEVGKYVLTDLDYIMLGNTFFKWDNFEFRNA